MLAKTPRKSALGPSCVGLTAFGKIDSESTSHHTKGGRMYPNATEQQPRDQKTRPWRQGGTNLFQDPSHGQNQSQRTAPIQIRVDRDFTRPRVIDLLREHLAGMHAESLPEKVCALNLGAPHQSKIPFLTAWRQNGSEQTDDP
ncbi:hypothetical protein [Hydrogenophaga sp. PAMC20947]|uniref:hypothetical protein n=1 Tax=Hydrogenophaga sp. PAMC20947 TaxID=2565558 RepID=UPI001B350CFB|nr:hypothetical protein [Hydrogenophaga sp. PAMC20947]